MVGCESSQGIGLDDAGRRGVVAFETSLEDRLIFGFAPYPHPVATVLIRQKKEKPLNRCDLAAY